MLHPGPPRLLANLGSHLLRSCSTFEVFRGTPSTPSTPSTTSTSSTPSTPANPATTATPTKKATVVVFGFAGSPRVQVEKIAAVYQEQGHTTLACVLPQLDTFTYNMPNIRACAHQVLRAAEEEGAQQVVCHSLSNNGSILYQQFVAAVQEEGRLEVRGAVFDSAPGPLGLQNIQKYWRLDTLPALEGLNRRIERWSPRHQTPLFLPFHLVGVDLANRKPLATVLSNLAFQLRVLPSTWRGSRRVPWCGAYMKEHEDQAWPLLFIYAKNDALLSWRYVEEVVRRQQARGRKVLTTRFETSGKGGHVAHLKYHPEEYKQAVAHLLTLT